MSEAPQIVEVDLGAVQAVLARSEALLPKPDYALLKGLVESHLVLTRLVRERGTTIARLRRLVGMPQSERTADVLGHKTGQDSAAGQAEPARESGAAQGEPGESTSASDEEASSGASLPSGGDAGEATKRRKGHGRVPAAAYPAARHITVPHQSLTPGDVCPACGRGKLYRLEEPARFLRIVGQAPLAALCWDCERLRCGGCGAVHTAQAPTEALGPKYSETAVAMMALLRYGTGMPLNRLEHLERDLGTPLPASTQWDAVNAKVGAVRPVYDELRRIAAQGSVVHNDDTYVRILELMGKRRALLLKCGELEDPERTGLFTTAIVSISEDKRPIALFFSGRKHAGENLAALLEQRGAELDPPILMSDALSRNLPEGHRVIESNCIAHGRRRIVDEVANFPAECTHVLETLAEVFKVDERCRKEGRSDEERLRVHQQESASLMNDLEAWMQAQLDEKRIEPNSGMGEAFNYMLKRWDNFTLFLRVPGAPLDNNIVERALKKAIQQRNNSLFYRSEHGARVGDIYMTLIYTAQLHRQNPFDYLIALFEHEGELAAEPAAWLPWTYRATLAAIEARRGVVDVAHS
jgi:transposase